jgi:hypothetical protein
VSGVALFAAVTLAVAPVHGERLTHTDAVMAIKGEAVQTFYSFTENHLRTRARCHAIDWHTQSCTVRVRGDRVNAAFSARVVGRKDGVILYARNLRTYRVRGPLKTDRAPWRVSQWQPPQPDLPVVPTPACPMRWYWKCLQT